MVAAHRNDFYVRLTKGEADASTIDDWNPPPNNANLKSAGQLREWMHVARHWNTGADGLDAGAFRARHKTWYSRMKPASYNLGRRTGIHLRTTTEDGGKDGKETTVLCRYNKAGTKSVVYLEVGKVSACGRGALGTKKDLRGCLRLCVRERYLALRFSIAFKPTNPPPPVSRFVPRRKRQLFDALFQIHALELNHRGRDATKNLADARYANVPDGTVRAFLETCPICAIRRHARTGGDH